MSLYWIYLFSAILLEVAGTTAMKLSEGFSRLFPSIFMFAAYAASLGMLTLAMKKIEVGTAYAVWSGIGTAMIAMIGVFIFQESISLIKITAIALILAGVVMLNLSGMSH